MAFGGWPAEALAFYVGLEDDNSKEYWTKRKAVYQEQVLRPMEELLDELAPEFGEPKIFRPYRDIRFSHDKTPYKTHIGATIGSTCYVQLSADGLSVGAGRWHLEPPELTQYRAAVAGPDGAELAAVVESLRAAGVEVHGHGTLKSAPRLPRRPPADRAAKAQGADHLAALEPLALAVISRRPGAGPGVLPGVRGVLRLAHIARRGLIRSRPAAPVRHHGRHGHGARSDRR